MNRIRQRRVDRARRRRTPSTPWYATRTAKTVEFIGIVAAMCAIVFEVTMRLTEDRAVARATLEEIRQAQIARAWETVFDSNHPKDGRLLALHQLFERGVDMGGVDLSCAALGSEFTWNEVRCWDHMDVGTVQLNRSLPLVMVGGTDFRGLTFRSLNAERSFVGESDWRGIQVKNGSSARGAFFVWVSLDYADLKEVDFDGATLPGSSISGTVFATGFLELDPSPLNGAFFWIDNPPRFFDEESWLDVNEGQVPRSQTTREQTIAVSARLMEEGREAALARGAIACPVPDGDPPYHERPSIAGGCPPDPAITQ